MPVDPKKMEAWLRPTDEEGDGSDDAPADEPMPEEEEGDEEVEAEGDLESRFPTLFQLMENEGQEFEEASEVLDPDLLTSADTQYAEGDGEYELLQEAAEGLSPEMQEALRSEAGDLDWETANEIAEALEAGEHITDPERVAGFLFHVRQCLA